MTADHLSRVRGVALLTCLAVAGVLAASTAADAATLRLRCAGKGARNVDSAGTVLCAASPSKGRTIAGAVRDDAGKPVAATLTVTYGKWTPIATGGYRVEPARTREITAKGDGTFAIKSTTATRESITVDVVADAALGTAAGASAQAQVSRKLKLSLKKLGGGRLRISVKGTKVRPIKVYVLSESGFELPGIKPKNVDRRGRASFNLGSRRGRFAYYVDTGVYDDLFWYQGRPPFRL